MAPTRVTKDRGFAHYIVSNKLKTAIVFAIVCIALYLVKESFGILWSGPQPLKLDITWGKMSGSISDFFQTNGDVTRITWAHAVNNQESLDNIMKSDTMMLEADVQISVSKDGHQGIAIMAHSPATDSDLSLSDFLAATKHSQKGIKLDFKSTEAVEAGLKILAPLKAEIKVPLWLNSDLVQGTSARPVTVEADRFFQLITKYNMTFPISVGWTLGMPSGLYKGGYDWSMVHAMAQMLENHTIQQPITFAVEATYARWSLEQLKWLVDKTKGSITVWFYIKTKVSVKDIICIVETFGKDKTFLDIPPEFRTELNTAWQGKTIASGSAC